MTARLGLLLGFIFNVTLSITPAFAAPVKSLDFTIHEEYASTRALGMGNAFTAVADDHSAQFYNPANLAFREDGQLRMFLRGGTTPETISLFNEIKKTKSQTSGLTTEEKTQKYVDLVESHYGDHYYFRAPTLGLMWVRPGWGIAFIPADLSLDMGVHRQIGPMLNINMYMDSTLAFGYAHKMNWFGRNHQQSWGITLKAVHRVYVGEVLAAAQMVDNSNVFSTKDANEGLTGDIDIGTTWSPPVKYIRPTFAIVGRNLVDYGFKTNFHLIDKQSGEPPKLGRRLDLGSKWDLPKFWVFDPHLAFDIRNIGHENWTWRKGAHAGAELYWKMYNWWKGYWTGGLNEGYWTAGFGARLAWFQVDICSFGEEVGSNSHPQEDRRYMLELALDF
jgi:hypothetical protein